MVDALASSDRFFEILDTQEETPDSPTATRIEGVKQSVPVAGACCDGVGPASLARISGLTTATPRYGL